MAAEAVGGEEVAEVELAPTDDDLAELERRRAKDALAPEDDGALARYLVYLGEAYLEAEAAARAEPDDARAYRRLLRLCGAAGGGRAAVHYRYAETSRRYAEEQRAHAAHDRMAGAYEWLVERMRDEIGIRGRRIENLEQACE